MSESEKPEQVSYLITGIWKVFRPDTRQYKQQSIEIEFNQPVAVEVPSEYVLSSEEHGLILTPAGMRYVQEQFEKMFADTADTGKWDESVVAHEPPADGWDVPATANIDDWGPDPSTQAVLKNEQSSVEGGWGAAGGVFDAAEPASQPDVEIWDESSEDWKS